MLISIIMPIYNSEKFLDRAIQSVLNQSWKKFELLLIDDGSTDDSYSICTSYSTKDKRVKVFKKTNQGVSSARNFGLSQASGEYISFIDSDDAYSPNYLESLINGQKNEYDLTVCGIIRNNEEKNCFSLELKSKEEINNKIIDLLNSGLFNSPVNKLYKNSIIKINNIKFNEQSSMGEDYLFNLDYLDCSSNCRFINQAEYIYYIQNQSITYRYREDEFVRRRYSIDRTSEYFKKYNIKNDFCDSMKIKLVYSCSMQEFAFKNKRKVYNEFKKDSYFSVERPKTKTLLILYYCMKNYVLFYGISFLLYLMKYRIGMKWKGASI